MKWTTIRKKCYEDSNVEFTIEKIQYEDGLINYEVWIYGEEKASFLTESLKEATEEFERIFEEKDLTGWIRWK